MVRLRDSKHARAALGDSLIVRGAWMRHVPPKGRRGWLVRMVAQLCDVSEPRRRECRRCARPPERVPSEELVKQRSELGRSARERRVEFARHDVREAAHVRRRLRLGDPAEVFVGDCAEHHPLDEPELMEAVVAGEEGLASQQLRRDAAHTVDVHRGPDTAGVQQQLGWAVPALPDVIVREASRGGRRHVRQRPRVSEFRDAQVAVLGHEQSSGLDAAVHDSRRVEGLEPTEKLVDEVLVVVVGQ
mmetsp:Transcript_163148/g.523161  ORF Transcript_163148/g.523161 Transcript_163148/m.523161 type:complete len:245 (-) Transcript_163148:735-1469(-)